MPTYINCNQLQTTNQRQRGAREPAPPPHTRKIGPPWRDCGQGFS